MSKKAIGIDLGTGFSAVAVLEGNEPTIIANAEGHRTTPSVVGFKDGERKIGDAANRQRIAVPKETISLIKRFMGLSYDDCKEIIPHMTYDVVNRAGKPRIVVGDKEYSPEEISAMILTKMKQSAEDYLGETVTDAVITCPAWFDNAAREATKAAGEIAGLKVHRVINEPTAAILAAKIPLNDDPKKVLVADIGCGTTDFSVCELSNGLVEVLASKGDVFLGGSDFDNAIAKWVTDAVKAENEIDLTKDAQAMQRILEAAEKAKIELSQSTSTDINLPYISAKNGIPIHFVKSLTRAQFDQMTADLVKRIVEKGQEALKDADTTADELDCVLLVGGQTRSIAIQEAIKNNISDKLNKSVNPDEAVAMGAAIQANACLEGSSDIVLLDVTPISMGIETMGGVFTKLIEANATIPCKKTETFSTAVDNQPSVDINVLQGERPMAAQNKSVGLFRLDGIVPARRGVPQIEVTFDIDANGILTVSAKDKGTGKEQHITVESNGLSKEDIEKMKAEAEANAEADKKAREIADAVNKADSVIFNNESMLQSSNDKMSEDEKKEITDLVEEMKKARDEKDINKINDLEKTINEKWNTIAQKMYSQAQSAPTDDTAKTAEASTESTTDNVQDANFEEVK